MSGEAYRPNIGDKVVPVNKSVGCRLDVSIPWNTDGKQRGYLYVTPGHGGGDIGCAVLKGSFGGDYFNYGDVLPYREGEIELEKLICTDASRSQGNLTEGRYYEVHKTRRATSKDGVERDEVLIVNDKTVAKWYDASRFSTPAGRVTIEEKTIGTVSIGKVAHKADTPYKVGDLIVTSEQALSPRTIYKVITIGENSVDVQNLGTNSRTVTQIKDRDGNHCFRKATNEELEEAGYGTIEPVKVTPQATAPVTQPNKKRVTLSDYLVSQGVPQGVVTELSNYRKEFDVPDEEKSRLVTKPSTLYVGGEMWTLAISALLSGCNVLLEGEKATGKNVLAENLAFAFGRPMYDVSMHVNIDASSLIGSDTFAEGEVKFRPGSIYRAATAGGYAVLDEINMAKTEAVAVLHAVLDSRRVIDVPGYSRIKLHEATRFIGTMNFGYVGTRELNEALVSRFVVIHVPALGDKAMVDLLSKKYPDADKGVLALYTKLFNDVQAKAKNGEISTKCVDLRGILDALAMTRLGVKPNQALVSCIVNKAFDDFERVKVNDILKTLFPEGWSSGNVFPATGKASKSVNVDFSNVR